MKTINFKNYQVKTISLKEGLCNQVLTEVYKKSDKALFLSFFRNLRDYLLDKKTKKEVSHCTRKLQGLYIQSVKYQVEEPSDRCLCLSLQPQEIEQEKTSRNR